MVLFIVRHAQVHYGQGASFDPNPNLTALGRRQAAALSDRLKGVGLTHLYSSPALRCLQTADAICDATGLPATVVPWLSEIGWVWRCTVPPRDEVRQHLPAAEMVEPPTEAEWGFARDEGGDSEKARASAEDRRGRAVARTLFSRHPLTGEDRVCLVTHAAFAGWGLVPSLLAVSPRSLATGSFDNATLTELRFEAGRNCIVRANDARHLVGLQAVICSNPNCRAEPSPHWEDLTCRICGSPMLVKCPHCRVAAIPNPVPARCPECGERYKTLN